MRAPRQSTWLDKTILLAGVGGRPHRRWPCQAARRTTRRAGGGTAEQVRAWGNTRAHPHLPRSDWVAQLL